MSRHTLRGRVDAGDTLRLIIDDGMLNQGHKVVEFHVWAQSIASGDDPACVLAKSYDANPSWDASDNRQIGWAGQTTTNTTRMMQFDLLDPDAIVVQDLFLINIGTTVANYLVVIEPIHLTDDQAVMQLIKERSQDDIR